MIASANVQLYYFVLTIAAGLIIGILFDSYRIIRGFGTPGSFVTAAADILFWIFAAVLIFIYLLFTTNGELRYYTLVALIIGIIIYFKLISRVFLKTLRWVIYYIMKLFRMILMIIFYPVKLIMYFISYIIYIIRNFMKKCTKSAEQSKPKIKKFSGFKIKRTFKKEK